MGTKLDGVPRAKPVGKEDAPTQRRDDTRTAKRRGRQCCVYARRWTWHTLGPVEGGVAAGEPRSPSHTTLAAGSLMVANRLSEIGTTAP